jgi:hypothetical protein
MGTSRRLKEWDKVIKGEPILKRSPALVDSCESLPLANELLHLDYYFAHLRSHSNAHPDDRDTAHFYPNPCYTSVPYHVGEIRKHEITIDLPISSRLVARTLFSDLSSTAPDHNENTFIKRAIDLYLRINESYTSFADVYLVYVKPSDADRFIAAVYFPSLNVLFATDWTHHSDGVRQILVPLWPRLVDQLHLTPKFAAHVRTYRPKPPRISLGCDPEFECIDPLDPSYILDPPACAKSGSIYDSIGVDGAGLQVELRPRPALKPLSLVHNLRQLFVEFARLAPDIGLAVVGDEHPVGGHIHVGLGRKLTPPENLLTLLDDFLGIPTTSLSGYARGSYGQPSDYETKDHGFEYRTPPAAIFHHPAIARISLKIARNITHKFFSCYTFRYNDPPNTYDYMRIAGLTFDEAVYFLSFCDTRLKYENIIPLWYPRYSPPKIAFIFRDAWNDKTRELLRQHLARRLRRILPPACKFSLHLYGLKQERGYVFSFRVPRYPYLPTPPTPVHPDSYTFVFGFPYDFRIADPPDPILIRFVALSIIREIRKHL